MSTLKAGTTRGSSKATKQLFLGSDPLYQAGGICYSLSRRNPLLLWSELNEFSNRWSVKGMSLRYRVVFDIATDDNKNASCGYCSGLDNALILFNDDGASNYVQLYQFPVGLPY